LSRTGEPVRLLRVPVFECRAPIAVRMSRFFDDTPNPTKSLSLVMNAMHRRGNI